MAQFGVGKFEKSTFKIEIIDNLMFLNDCRLLNLNKRKNGKTEIFTIYYFIPGIQINQ